MDDAREIRQDDAISRQAVLDLAKKGVLISNGNYESVCKAINEIPSVNPQPCEDAISRQAVLDAFADYVGSGMSMNDFDALYDIVAKMPSVQPKTGHWECTELFYEGESRGAIIRCSKCGNEFKVSPKVFESLYDNEKFCNHCGCRMESEEE